MGTLMRFFFRLGGKHSHAPMNKIERLKNRTKVIYPVNIGNSMNNLAVMMQPQGV